MSIEQISFEEYRARPGLNSHYIKDLLRSPAHAQYNRGHDHDSPTLAFGRAFHAAILEPAELLKSFIVAPDDLDRRTKAGKVKYAELIGSGKTVIAAHEMNQVNSMSHAIRSHKVAREIIGNIKKAETSVFWEMSGLPCKARIDGLDEPIVVDLKTANDASKRAWERAIPRYGYHLQAAWYMEALFAHNHLPNRFIHVVVESAPPYGVAVYELDEMYLEQGREEIQRALDIYKQCVKADVWPSYPETIQPVLVPAWMTAGGEDA